MVREYAKSPQKKLDEFPKYTVVQLGLSMTLDGKPEEHYEHDVAAGKYDATSDPETYSLYTASDVTSAESTARTTGQNDVTNNLATYSLYTANDVTSAEATARTAGQTDVTGDPATYSLFTAADVTGAETAARTLGQQDVVNAPSSFDLYTASDLVVPKFLNLSNRAYVGTGDEILIGSMIILDKPMRILVRASGPSLANAADPVPNPLLDPTLQLYCKQPQISGLMSLIFLQTYPYNGYVII